MATLDLHDAVTERCLGTTHTHHVPRIGEAVDWRGAKWRVLDVQHPTEDDKGVGIYPPRVFVVDQDAPTGAAEQQ
jgi:hypothetical protein